MFLKLFLLICHPETREIITNALAAERAGEIDHSQVVDVVKHCIQVETEKLALDKIKSRA